MLITAGNLSFLNWLTLLPAVWCLDDQFLAAALPRFLKPGARVMRALVGECKGGGGVVIHESLQGER
jgi:hypothetical protein